MTKAQFIRWRAGRNRTSAEVGQAYRKDRTDKIMDRRATFCTVKVHWLLSLHAEGLSRSWFTNIG
jgi:hypothetical protein